MSDTHEPDVVLFNVYGIDSLPDEAFDVGGGDYPKHGADHEAHDAANVVYHALKNTDRFDWTDDITGVAMGYEDAEEDDR